MKIHTITIKNFKGIQHLTLNLRKEPLTKIFTLIGLNESGKITVLEAIDLLENNLPLAEAHTLIPKSKKMDFSGTVEISIKYIWEDSDNGTVNNFIKKFDYKSLKPVTSHIVTQKFEFVNSECIRMPYSWSVPLQV